uniref:Secreted protein n=1 Tax=Electrophorus electricus TaxID=8005 RepID=A0AAY5F0S4_ELEEL
MVRSQGGVSIVLLLFINMFFIMGSLRGFGFRAAVLKCTCRALFCPPYNETQLPTRRHSLSEHFMASEPNRMRFNSSNRVRSGLEVMRTICSYDIANMCSDGAG